MSCPLPLPTARPVGAHRDPRAFTPGLLRLALTFLAAGGAAGALHGQEGHDEHGHGPIPVVLTISGGKSLGAYQAGLNWALIRAFEHSTDGRGVEEHPILGRPFHLVAATGASAGNINALVSAVEWCDRDASGPPEESLFWKVWVWTGWEQLLSPDAYAVRLPRSESVFHRDFFQTHYRNIGRTMEEADPRRCDLPVGVTLTRLIPGTIELSELQIPTQRFLSVFRVASDSVGRKLRFRLADEDIRNDAALGKAVFLAAADDGSHPDSLVYELTAASSAFPLAFEPIRLAVGTGTGCSPDGAGCDLTTFLDGGLFDNSPLDLALGIYDHLEDTGEVEPEQDDHHPRFIYIDAGNLRNPISDVEVAGSTPMEGRGIGAGRQMVSGAIPAARKYELHALARTLKREGRRDEEEWIRVTSRAFPITGEHLAGFGAFLGRPFREFDFYVGVYDGLRFLAEEVCADPERHREPGRVDRPDPRVTRSCTARTLRHLVEEDALALGPAAPLIVAGVFASEFPEEPPLSVDSTSLRADRRLVLGALLEANRALMAPRDRSHCRTRALLERLICQDGFEELLDSLRATDGFQETIDAWASPPSCARTEWRTAPEHCLSDESFRQFVRSPETFLNETMERVLRQLWRVEKALEDEGAPNSEKTVELLELWFRSAGVRYRHGLELFPSTIPAGERMPRQILRFFPYFASVAAGTQGGEIFGYRPTYHLSPSLALVAPLSIHYVRPVENPDETWRWRGGVGVLWKRANIMASGLELTLDRLRAFDWDREDTASRTLLGTSLTGYLLGGKVTATLRWIPGNASESYNGDDVSVILGIADLSGAIYWVSRGLLF